MLHNKPTHDEMDVLIESMQEIVDECSRFAPDDPSDNYLFWTAMDFQTLEALQYLKENL